MARIARQMDYEAIRNMASIGCTDKEIATVTGFTAEWICKRKKTDTQLAEAIDVGREEGKTSLRRMQWHLASSGNATMLIWLGKQMLGQRDKHELGGDPDRPLNPANRVPTDEELLAIAAQALPKKDGGSK